MDDDELVREIVIEHLPEEEELEVVRLSSKSHWDVPVKVGGHTVHVLASHPTPPTFDGEEDRNGRRNHDEIRFWADYVSPGKAEGDTGSPKCTWMVLGRTRQSSGRMMS